MSAVLKEVPRKKRRTVNVEASVHVGYIDVDVDIDIAEIDTADLLAELDERGDRLGSTGLLEIYEAMKFGKNETALELMRTYLQDTLGRVLP